jgi:halocyanin-like protein
MNMNRRDFLQTAGGVAGATATATAAAGSATAQETTDGGGTTTASGTTAGGGTTPSGDAPTPDLGGYLDDVGNYDGTIADRRGQGTVTVQVGTEGNGGNFAFSPPAIHVANGTTVQFEWTGEGGGHNVVAESEAFNSGSTVAEAGINFEHTFNEDGVYQYFCNPHKANGMKGVVVVGTDYPTVAAGGGGAVEQDPEHMGVPFQAHFVGLSTVLAILASLIFTFFLLKYGESPNTKGGNN